MAGNFTVKIDKHCNRRTKQEAAPAPPPEKLPVTAKVRRIRSSNVTVVRDDDDYEEYSLVAPRRLTTFDVEGASISRHLDHVEDYFEGMMHVGTLGGSWVAKKIFGS